ncbi:hypothetical protein Pan241w_14600 [Gimesia alba]|uniref:Uncharacterized protein n=1 Tax=Gimesia alba TaxID=2527973 RepID=A0A517RBY9_9PLAN|nr:hypothetical protein [Gimesia alba]QDT41400.1 hypothetical protein Pan241w_14600 [Gimesia alba]
MSKERMQDLLALFRARGWDLENCDELFLVEKDEVIRWNLFSEKSDSTILLEFHLFGDLGQAGNALSEIVYCESLKEGHKLFFEKQNSDSWRENSLSFVLALCHR